MAIIIYELDCRRLLRWHDRRRPCRLRRWLGERRPGFRRQLRRLPRRRQQRHPEREGDHLDHQWYCIWTVTSYLSADAEGIVISKKVPCISYSWRRFNTFCRTCVTTLLAIITEGSIMAPPHLLLSTATLQIQVTRTDLIWCNVNYLIRCTLTCTTLPCNLHQTLRKEALEEYLAGGLKETSIVYQVQDSLEQHNSVTEEHWLTVTVRRGIPCWSASCRHFIYALEQVISPYSTASQHSPVQNIDIEHWLVLHSTTSLLALLPALSSVQPHCERGVTIYTAAQTHTYMNFRGVDSTQTW